MTAHSFLDKLLTRLKSGDARSIHLNALPSNFARLDIYDLINIESSLHLKFLSTLLSKRDFKFSITIDATSEKNKTAEEKKIVQKIIKRLNHLDYQEKEEFAEHGFLSFGFGYPLLIKRDPNNEDRIIKAPILIWYLSIEKDTRRNNTWTISRNEEHPLLFNELLQAHFENNEKIKTDELEELIEDDFIDETQLLQFCKSLLDKLNIPFDTVETIATLVPASNKETIDNNTKAASWIRWSGILGLFKMQKQSIIKDVELLMQYENIIDSENNNYFDGEILSPVTLDPSQENVLQQIKQHDNIIIQGPPGTGKSQSLTAIITQALLNQQKVLVVCEKRTAMEVLYNNLKKENLEHLCVLIEEVYSDRKTIVERVRLHIENAEHDDLRFRSNEYELARSKFLTLQEEINHRINFSNNVIFGDDNWLELLQKGKELNQNKSHSEKANALIKLIRNSDYVFTYNEFIELSKILKNAAELYQLLSNEAFIFDAIQDDNFEKIDNSENLKTRILQLQQDINSLSTSITNNIQLYNNDYDVQTGFTAFKVKLLSYFSNKYKNIIQQKENTKASLYQLIQQFNQYDFIPIDLSIDVANEKISNVIPAIQNIQITCDDYVQQIQHLPAYFEFRKFKLSQKTATQNLIQALIQIKCDEWCAVFETYYINQAILKIAMENGIKDDSQKLYEELVLADIHCKQKLAEKINHTWKIMQQESIKTKDLTAIKYLYNQRKNKQFSSKNSLRKIVHQDFDFFTTLFPVVMVNPSVCTSILPLQKNLFDFIVLDEASQLRVEDTYSSLLRGKTKIISGDKHQMPPSNFFGSETIFWNKEEEDDADSYLAESKSLLEYAEDANFKSTYLDYHYRSLHPSLIQFSNHAFYQSRLIPLPEKENYQAIHFTSVDGIYKDGTNIAEANAIVDLVFSLESWKDNFPSVGIATFNIFQRDLIYDLLFEQAYKDNAKNEKLQALLNQGLFVKNLENIQGDERDVMILSSTFGKDEQGKFRQFFGPLTQEKGYQLLNVIITRAKHSLHVYTSVPETTFSLFEEELAIKGNKGKSIFYAYLSYVKACVDKNQTQIDYIKSCLQKNNPPMLVHKKQRTSILKESVFNALQNEFGENVQLNFALGGFVLDIVLLKDNKPYLHIDFENTNLYHHEVTYRIKLHQQKIVEQYHIKTYHLWSYNWWNAAENEIKNISDCYLSN